MVLPTGFIFTDAKVATDVGEHDRRRRVTFDHKGKQRVLLRSSGRARTGGPSMAAGKFAD